MLCAYKFAQFTGFCNVLARNPVAFVLTVFCAVLSYFVGQKITDFMKMPPKKSPKTPPIQTMQYSDTQYEELFNTVIHNKTSLRKSPRISAVLSPMKAGSLQDTAEEPQECASLENSQKEFTKISESRKLSDYSCSNLPDTISTLQSEEFRNNATFSTPILKNMKTEIVPKDLNEESLSSAPKVTKNKHKSFKNAIQALNTSQSAFNDTLSQGSSAYSHLADMIPFSQAPKNLSHRERLLWLRDRRGTGLYGCCDSCEKWRYLPTILDPLDLPTKWFCKMNSDRKYSHCSVPEQKLPMYVTDDLIYNLYTAGSLVWARYLNYPWWPAIVEDDPDTEQYYWLEKNSDVPSYYHVMFFDAPNKPVTRGWVIPKRIKPFVKNLGEKNTNKKYFDRIQSAKQIALRASELNVKERLEKYGFVAYSNLEIYTPVASPDVSDDEEEQPTFQQSRRSLLSKKKTLDINENSEFSSDKKSLTSKNSTPQRKNEVLKSVTENSFEGKEKNRKVSKLSKSAAIKNRRYTVAEQTEMEIKIAKVSELLDSAMITNTRRNTVSELSLIDNEKQNDEDTENREWFQTRPRPNTEKISEQREPGSKSPKTNKNSREELVTKEKIQYIPKRRHTIFEDRLEVKRQSQVNKKCLQESATKEIKNRHKTIVMRSFDGDEESIKNRIDDTTYFAKTVEDLEMTPVVRKSISKRRNTNCDNSFDTKVQNINKENSRKSAKIYNRRNTTASRNFDIDEASVKNTNDDSKLPLALEMSPTLTSSSKRRYTVCDDDGFETTNETNKITSKDLKRRNSDFYETHITAKNDSVMPLKKSKNRLSSNQSSSKYESKLKMISKEIFDEDSNSALQKMKNLGVSGNNLSKLKKPTSEKASKNLSLANKGYVRPLKLDKSSNSLNNENVFNSFSSSNFNSGNFLGSINDPKISFNSSFASQNETKAKKRLGYSKK